MCARLLKGFRVFDQRQYIKSILVKWNEVCWIKRNAQAIKNQMQKNSRFLSCSTIRFREFIEKFDFLEKGDIFSYLLEVLSEQQNVVLHSTGCTMFIPYVKTREEIIAYSLARTMCSSSRSFSSLVFQDTWTWNLFCPQKSSRGNLYPHVMVQVHKSKQVCQDENPRWFPSEKSYCLSCG